MPRYRDLTYFKEDRAEPEFNRLHNPGEIVPYSGIYRCEGCQFEDVDEQRNRFPPAKDVHVCRPGATKWRLVALAIHESK
jgi:hypothetical protein